MFCLSAVFIDLMRDLAQTDLFLVFTHIRLLALSLMLVIYPLHFIMDHTSAVCTLGFLLLIYPPPIPSPTRLLLVFFLPFVVIAHRAAPRDFEVRRVPKLGRSLALRLCSQTLFPLLSKDPDKVLVTDDVHFKR